MNEDSLGLIIFALIALGAVFAFIFILGGPEQTGQVSGTQQPVVSWFKFRDAYEACSSGTHCNDGLPGIPTGNWEPNYELYECRCQTSDSSFLFWRSQYAPG